MVKFKKINENEFTVTKTLTSKMGSSSSSSDSSVPSFMLKGIMSLCLWTAKLKHQISESAQAGQNHKH